MELKAAKRKKLTESSNNVLCSYITNQNNKCESVYVGYCCYVTDPQHINELFYLGYFGKGNLSRSVPVFADSSDFPEVISEQQYENRSRLFSTNETSLPLLSKSSMAEKTVAAFILSSKTKKTGSWNDLKNAPSEKSCNEFENPWIDNSSAENVSTDKVLQGLVDSILATGLPRRNTSETCDSVLVVTDNGPKLKTAPHRPKELLVLNLQETFFLAGAVGKLRVVSEADEELDLTDMWTAFMRAEDNFIERYVVYHWFRSKGWIVRNGLKEGGDFVLYEQGPPFCHSSYVVRVQRLGAELQWEDFTRLQRLVETIKKDIVVCQVAFPDEEIPQNFQLDWLTRCRVLEVMWRRKIPSQQRTAK